MVGAGFDSKIFHSHDRHEDQHSFRLLFAGKISSSKGFRELLEAVGPMLSDSVKLSVAGSGHGPESEALQTRARELGVKLLGRLSQSELSAEMRKSAVFVLPSYYEGLPLVLAEALACGCRIVVSDLPGLRDWLPKPLVETGWVSLVDLPTLEVADRPVTSEIPSFIERLNRAVKKQRAASSQAPKELEPFLFQNSWSGVFERIRQHYGVESYE